MGAGKIESSEKDTRELPNPQDGNPSAAGLDFTTIMSNSKGLAGQGDRSTVRSGDEQRLVFDDVYTTNSDTTTRAFQRAGSEGDKAKVDEKAQTGDAKTFKTFTVQGDLDKLDVFKPTVAFLDTGRTDPIKFDQYQLSHGQVSALAASKNGFNSFILDIDGHRTTSMSEHLSEIDKSIETGKLPLGKGDVLNISVDKKDMMTLAKLNGDLEKGGKALSQLLEQQNPPLKLELPVTAENLAKNRPALLKSLEYLAPRDEAYAEALATNKALESITKRGVTVLSAAGNEGPHRIDLNNLTVKNQLGSGDEAQQCDDPFSTTNSLTQKADGAVGVYAKLDEKGQPDGNFIMNNNGNLMEFSKDDLARLDPTHNNHVPGTISNTVHLEFDGKDVPRSQAGINTIFQPLELPSGVTKPAVLCGDNSNERVPLEIDKAPLILETAGTSFANIGWLKEHRQELQKQKDLPN